MRRVPCTFLFSLACLCSCGSQPPEVRQDSQGPVLGHIQSQHQRITITGTGQGALFTVTNKKGAVIDKGLTLSEFRNRHPELFKSYDRGMAHHPLDSRVDPQTAPSYDAPRFPHH